MMNYDTFLTYIKSPFNLKIAFEGRVLNISNAILTTVVAVLSNDIKFVISSFFIFGRSNKIFHYALSEKIVLKRLTVFCDFRKYF